MDTLSQVCGICREIHSVVSFLLCSFQSHINKSSFFEILFVSPCCMDLLSPATHLSAAIFTNKVLVIARRPVEGSQRAPLQQQTVQRRHSRVEIRVQMTAVRK